MGSHLRHLVIIGAPKRFWLKSVVDKLQGPHIGQVSLCLFNKLIRLRFPQILKLLRPGWKLADVSTIYQSNWPKNSGQGVPLSLLHEPVPSLKRVTGCKALDAGVSNFSQGAASLLASALQLAWLLCVRPYTSQCTAANLQELWKFSCRMETTICIGHVLSAWTELSSIPSMTSARCFQSLECQT